MTTMLQALRGATTLELDTKEQVMDRTTVLIQEMMARNGVIHDDLVSVIFTATRDIHSEFPAAAARAIGVSDIPLLCALELDIDGALPLCIRVMMHFNTSRPRSELRHVYLEGAVPLRTDLHR